MRKVLVCGDRNYTDLDRVRECLRILRDKKGFGTVIEGEARGADTMGRIAATELGMEVIPVPAQWDKYGRSAGPIRNQEMLKLGPDLVLAFHKNISESKGTAHMLKIAEKAGVVTRLVK